MSFRKQIDALTKKRNALLDTMTTTSDLALAETRSFTADEQTQFDKDQAELKDLDGQLDRLLAAEVSLGRRADPATDCGSDRAVGGRRHRQAGRPARVRHGHAAVREDVDYLRDHRRACAALESGRRNAGA